VNAVVRGNAWMRRAKPLLGTLVEVGLPAGAAMHEAAFAAIAEVQAVLSRFEASSDVGRFNSARDGDVIRIGVHAQAVFAAADILRSETGGHFDISLGTGTHAWRLDGDRLHKLSADVRLDLGGIAKGHAVDCAVDALIATGCPAGWVNAGGDLRAFGDIDLPLQLRDEAIGGVRNFGHLRDGAFATSHFDPAARPLAGPSGVKAHASVAAPSCLWADALTKVLALSGDTAHPLLARHGAQGWLH
jgi:thiamine biosynthesis lipoprotein